MSTALQMSPAHPAEPRDRAEMRKTTNPVQLLSKGNQVRQKKPSVGVIYSVPSSQPHCSRHCSFHLMLCRGHIREALEEPPWSLWTRRAGSSQDRYWEQHNRNRGVCLFSKGQREVQSRGQSLTEARWTQCF